MAKWFSQLFLSWFLILFLLQLHIQIGSSTGSNTTSLEVIELRIGVPKRNSFTEFVNVVWDSREEKYNVTGYCVEVFYAVIDLLPFKVIPKFEPYVNESRGNAGAYNELIQQVPKLYDAVVGDITILHKRAKYVDFTLPYAESGVRMIVGIQHGSNQNMWTFVKPFSWDLWLCILIISMFIGVVLLFMERNVHTIPEQKEGSSFRKQLSAMTILWFPISQAVLPEKMVVAKNCSRFVLMVWLLLAFVLMQSYTANLTSILTLDRIQPSFLSVDDLREGDHYVGYPANSFIADILVDRLKFNPLKLKQYNNVSEYHDALKKGRKGKGKGKGVSAIFHEVPYLEVFLKKYRSNYIMAGPTYRTDGFGFAFPLNSNLTSHFSRAILNLIESDKMNEIEEKYFGKNELEQIHHEQLSTASPSLTFHSFGGLFLITVVSTLLALLVSETGIWQRPFLMVMACSHRCFLRTPPSSQTHVPPTLHSTHEIESI